MSGKQADMPQQVGDLTDTIKSLALEAGGDVVGVAPVGRWDEFVPEGYRPDDILPGAKSVVVVGTRGPTMGAWKCPDARLMEVNGYDFANDRAIHIVANHIETEAGYYACRRRPCPWPDISR